MAIDEVCRENFKTQFAENRLTYAEIEKLKSIITQLEERISKLESTNYVNRRLGGKKI